MIVIILITSADSAAPPLVSHPPPVSLAAADKKASAGHRQSDFVNVTISACPNWTCRVEQLFYEPCCYHPLGISRDDVKAKFPPFSLFSQLNRNSVSAKKFKEDRKTHFALAPLFIPKQKNSSFYFFKKEHDVKAL